MAEPIRKSSDTEQRQRAAEAGALLENSMLKSALLAIEDHYMESWAATKLEDVKGREICFRMVKASGQFRYLLTRYVEDGMLTDAAIEQADRQLRMTQEE